MSTEGAARSTIASAGLTAALLIAQLVAAKATRDALFLSHFPAERLPLVIGASALFALLAAMVVARLLARLGPDRLVPWLLTVSGGLFALEWGLAAAAPSAVAAVVYAHTVALGATSVSAFWAMINERFDPHTARQVMGRIAVGAAAGGVLGGGLAWALSGVLDLFSMLAVLAAMNTVAALAARFVGGSGASAPSAAPDPRGGFRILGQRPYLRHLALLIALLALGDVAVDLAFKASAQAAMPSATELGRFFALFHGSVGVATFLVQVGIAQPLLSRFGLAPALASLPVAIFAVGAIALAAPALAVFTALRAVGSVLESSLFRSGYELLYTPVRPAEKRPTKTLIDVGGDKLGSALGAGLGMVVFASVPDGSLVLTGAAVVLALLALPLVSALHRGYVRNLAQGLTDGVLAAEELQATDATTRQTLAETVALDRQAILAAIDGERAMPSTLDSLLEGPLDAERVRELIPLLARDADLPRLVLALREVSPEPLLAALRDPSTPAVVRRRLPRVLRGKPSPIVVEGLTAALGDPVFEVRYRSAIALVRLVSREASLPIDRDAIFERARVELAQGLRRDRLDDGEEPHPLVGDHVTERLGRTVAHVFTLLSLVSEREPLQLALHALASDDGRLRGTGLEYLEHVLPADMLEALGPALRDRRVTRASARPPKQIIDELFASRDSLELDRRLLVPGDGPAGD